MLLVTFHGGSTGIMNVYAYDTRTGALSTDQALLGAALTEAELRGMVYANGSLYVVNGKKKVSTILCFQPPATGSTNFQFSYLSDFLGPALSSKKQHFKNSIAHPYAMQFFGSPATFAYVSNQDTNVVAQATVNSATSASIETGCQSAYLNALTSICPTDGCVYLDGTFVASQNGTLPDVEVAATDVPSENGASRSNLTMTQQVRPTRRRSKRCTTPCEMWRSRATPCWFATNQPR